MATMDVPVPAAVKAPPDVDELKKQIEDLESRVENLWRGSGCYAEIETQLSLARGQLANGAIGDARRAYDRAASAIRFAEASIKATPLA